MTTTSRTKSPREPVPAWEIAQLFPNQGHWDETEYFILTNHTNGLAELTDGNVEVLTMPTMAHQLIVQYLNGLFLAFVTARSLGRVLFAPLRVRLWPGVIREPDLVFMQAAHRERMGNDAWEGADLVVEVVSDDAESRERDLVRKRGEYARAGIPEYWIVDPREKHVVVLRLEQSAYVTHSEAGAGGVVRSALLQGFEVDVTPVFQAAVVADR